MLRWHKRTVSYIYIKTNTYIYNLTTYMACLFMWHSQIHCNIWNTSDPAISSSEVMKSTFELVTELTSLHWSYSFKLTQYDSISSKYEINRFRPTDFNYNSYYLQQLWTRIMFSILSSKEFPYLFVLLAVLLKTANFSIKVWI